MIRISLFVAITALIICTTEASTAQRRTGRRGHPVRVVHRVVVRHAHVRYAALPRWGGVIRSAPVGAVVIASPGGPYYFHQGIYYSSGAAGYTVVRPAVGIRIRELPVGYRRIVVGRRPYFYYYGTFYQGGNGGYAVVSPPLNAVVDALPDGYEVVERNGTEYYVLDGVYYAEVDAPEFEDGVGYQVVTI